MDKKLRYLWNNESLVSGEQGCRHRNNKTIPLHAVSPTFRTQPRLAASISARITRCSQQMGGAETARHGRQFSSWVNTSIVPGQAATLHCGIIQDPKKDRKEAGNKENLVKKLCFFLPQWISAKMMHVPRPSIIFQRSCWDFLILSNNYTYKIIGRSNQMQN